MLRAEYLDAPVGFSVLCPGFIAGDGMYQRMLDDGFRANRLVGETTTAKVTDRVVVAPDPAPRVPYNTEKPHA